MVGQLAEHTLVHFKGPTDELERDDARMLFAYALQYLVVAEIDDPTDVALRVVARLPPELRLAGLTEAQLLLALPDTALRALSPDYLATLPGATRAAIRRRLASPARPAASPSRPARRRKPRSRPA